MNRGAPPALLGVNSKCSLALVGLIAMGLWACEDQQVAPLERDGRRAQSMNYDNDDDHGPGGQSRPPRGTGGGRVDFGPLSFGGPEKNTGVNKNNYQTFSVHLRDKNRDNYPDQGSQVEITDHRVQYRINNKPMRLVSAGFTSTFRVLVPTPGCEPNLDAECCPRGGIEVQGIFDRKNTPQFDDLQFLIRLCDVSKGGSRKSKNDQMLSEPNDRLYVQVPGLPLDQDIGHCYTLAKAPEGIETFPPVTSKERYGAYLTGGNLDVDLKNVTETTPEATVWTDCVGSGTSFVARRR